MKRQWIIAVSLFLSLLTMVGCSQKRQTEENKKTIIIGVTAKPTYPDVIKYAIKPILEKKGYKIILKQIGESNLFNSSLVDGDIDINIGQHKSALNFFKANNKADISPLITVPSAHMGIFSDKLKVKSLDELKKEIKKGDIVAMPNDPTNLPRSLIFLENTGFIKLKTDVNRYTTTLRDIAENYYGLDFRVMSADQIPRSLNSITFGLIFGDDADLIGIFDKSIIREVNTDDLFLNVFVVRTKDLQAPWVKDFKAAVESEDFKNVIENPQYRFHKFYRPDWYVKKWGIKNK